MTTFNPKKHSLKILIVGPQKVGKSVIANSLSEFSQVVTPDYHPTVGCRILEMEKQFSDEQVKRIPLLASNKVNKIKIELWDVSGDKRYEMTWPALRYGAHGTILVIDSNNERFETVLDEWLNDFCGELNKNTIACFSYKKEDGKAGPDGGNKKPKQSREFPNLPICEVTNHMNDLLPQFNKFVTKILANLK